MAELKLIDANKLKRHYAWWGDTDERRMLDDIVDAQPAVDAVPVVRCGECKKYKPNFNGNGWCFKWGDNATTALYVGHNGFCSSGERMDAEGGE